jgi:hypothetical protein
MNKGYASEAYTGSGNNAPCILHLALDRVKWTTSNSGCFKIRRKATGTHYIGGQLKLPELVWI